MPIRQLPDNLVNRIAAGEVVERPASAVKELIENALDAGATRIHVTTAKGGKDLVRIADNGTGMDEADLALSIVRHATSKLSEDELDNILTLGFRGEALASIGAVSDLTILSRTASGEGHRISVAHGRVSEVTPASANQGTTIEVRNLFARTPARLKFLKTDRAETAAITDAVRRLALANPRVHVILDGPDRTELNWPAIEGASALGTRARQIIGEDFAANSIPIAYEGHGLTLAGLVGVPTFTRANSLSQYYFVNGRPVRDKSLLGAVRAAFSDFLFRDRFPVVALFVAIDPAEVDVNVHPAKAELRFRDPGLVRATLIKTIRTALAETGPRATGTLTGAALGSFHAQTRADTPRSAPAAAAPATHPSRHASPSWLEGLSEPSARPEAPFYKENTPAAEYPLGAPRAQMFENYIISQTEDALLLIDQHAAHERLVYEKFKAQMAAGPVASQAQLIPVVVELPEEDCDRLEEIAADLEQLGLYLERFGPAAIAVRETPALLGQTDVTALITDIADGLADWDGSATLPQRLEAILGRMACHGSVRSGRRLRQDEMSALLRAMEQTPMSGQCIHGRPTFVRLALSDIESLFGRR